MPFFIAFCIVAVYVTVYNYVYLSHVTQKENLHPAILPSKQFEHMRLHANNLDKAGLQPWYFRLVKFAPQISAATVLIVAVLTLLALFSETNHATIQCVPADKISVTLRFTAILRLNTGVMRRDSMILESKLLTKMLVQKFPHLEHSIVVSGSRFTVQKQNESGFDVSVEDDGEIIHLQTDVGFHDHWHLDMFSDAENAYSRVSGNIAQLLSPATRVKVKHSNDKPYRWLLQSRSNGKWVSESSAGLLIWNYFGSRSEKIFVNRHVES